MATANATPLEECKRILGIKRADPDGIYTEILTSYVGAAETRLRRMGIDDLGSRPDDNLLIGEVAAATWRNRLSSGGKLPHHVQTAIHDRLFSRKMEG
jgi:hypothetical protein